MQTYNEIKKKLTDTFIRVFQEGDEPGLYFAPGRVNLIGDHTDYNGGHVLPCALTIGTYGMVRKRQDRALRFYSLNFEKKGVFISSLEDLTPCPEADWTNYPKGVIWAFEQRGMKVPFGMDILLYGTIPNGSGLSSSASVEVLTGFFLRDLFGFDVSNSDIARLGQYAENNYNGMNCGIMDQFVIAMGKKGHALFLNTSDMAYEYVPVPDSNKFVIACSNIRRELNDSAYNERRAECETVLSELQQVIGIETLGDLTKETFDIYQAAIGDETRRKRARHAVYENQRTIEAAERLKAGDADAFGRLMNDSHDSLSEDFEVTGEKMDILAGAARAQEGVFGSRITGGGFGGCTVSLVDAARVEDFCKNVGQEYLEKTGIQADFHVVEIGDGPVKLS